MIPKLFEVLVPRYENHFGSYTSMRNLPSQELSYRNHRLKLSVLELKGSQSLRIPKFTKSFQGGFFYFSGNPWPPLPNTRKFYTNSLLNVLLDEAKKDFKAEKYRKFVEQRERELQAESEQLEAAEAAADDIAERSHSETVSDSTADAEAGSGANTNLKVPQSNLEEIFA